MAGTITQYRYAIEQYVTPEIRGQRRYYPLGPTIAALNAIRRGHGLARDPDRDRRRTTTRDDHHEPEES